MTEVDSFSHAYYSWRTTTDWIDASNFYAAHELGAKLKSRAALYDYFQMKMGEKEASC